MNWVEWRWLAVFAVAMFWLGWFFRMGVVEWRRLCAAARILREVHRRRRRMGLPVTWPAGWRK